MKVKLEENSDEIDLVLGKFCSNCGNVMQYTGIILISCPGFYEAKCTNCNQINLIGTLDRMEYETNI